MLKLLCIFQVRVAPFIEHPIVDYTLREPFAFDVIAIDTDQPGFEARTEYLQNKPAVIPSGEVPFDEKVQLEIDLLKTQSNCSRSAELQSCFANAGRIGRSFYYLSS